jgi:hypothetical protein
MHEDSVFCAEAMAATGSYGMGVNATFSSKGTKGIAAPFFLLPLFLFACNEFSK